MNNNKYPQFNPGQMNNNGPNPENNNNSYTNNQTFNPSQNTYPPQMPNNNYNPNQNYPYPNTLFQNIPQYPNPAYAQNNLPFSKIFLNIQTLHMLKIIPNIKIHNIIQIFQNL